LGEALKVGGHLSALRRTRVAGFSEKDAVSFQDLKDQRFSPLNLADVARTTFSVRELSVEEVKELSFGRPLSENGTTSITAAMSPDNRLIALLKDDGKHAKPIAVFAAAN